MHLSNFDLTTKLEYYCIGETSISTVSQVCFACLFWAIGPASHQTYRALVIRFPTTATTPILPNSCH